LLARATRSAISVSVTSPGRNSATSFTRHTSGHDRFQETWTQIHILRFYFRLIFLMQACAVEGGTPSEG
jgi:hypothetical protein